MFKIKNIISVIIAVILILVFVVFPKKIKKFFTSYHSDRIIQIDKLKPEFFSSGVGISRNECTKTSCDYITRQDFLKLINPNLTTLEIGPFDNPLVKNSKVKYFDVLTRDQIIEQINKEMSLESGLRDANSRNGNINISNIPNIDFVNPSGDMSSIDEKFDIVFSSHNIEHQIDLVTHLRQVSDLLNKNGEYYIIIPDKRYCFDHFIPESPLSDILGSFYSNRENVHSLSTVLAMICETGHNDASAHWIGNHGSTNAHDYLCYENAIKSFYQKNGEYINAHRWRFTPNQFEFIIETLYKMKLISLRVKKVYTSEPHTHEFKAILYKDTPEF